MFLKALPEFSEKLRKDIEIKVLLQLFCHESGRPDYTI